jgi:hypothetical protein
MPRDSVEKCSVVSQLSVTEEPREHRKSAHRKRLIDEGLLAVQSFDGRTARQRIFRLFHIGDLGIELADGAQPLRLSMVSIVQRLPKYVLPARGVVAEIEPIGRPVERASECLLDGCTRRAAIDASDHDVWMEIVERHSSSATVRVPLPGRAAAERFQPRRRNSEAPYGCT